MTRNTVSAAVHLWGRLIGAVSLEEGQTYATFQYDPEFAQSGIQVAPITMPLSTATYSFPGLPFETFKGLPGLFSLLRQTSLVTR